jgi:hypothetical protein
MNIDQLKEEIKVQQKLAEQLDIDRYDKDRYSNPYAREVERLQSLIGILEYDLEFDATNYSNTGTVEIKNYKGETLVYALRTGRWRYKNFPKVWYYSKNFDQFVEKFIRN